ncbi:UNVERIFIED_CONTAM: Nitrate reductase [NADH] 2 [Sesamum latifolium]|uniref:Nitrate reductase [NADH] 2 n=1 Tax=Sesamum latifolium TaxID=2727402 RepID=A0AAW2X3T0_9LAMI
MPHKGEIEIIFEHPTQPDNEFGGWIAKEHYLEKSSKENHNLKKSVSSQFMNTASKRFSIFEVKKHKFPILPGSSSMAMSMTAPTSSKTTPRKMLKDYRIGKLITTGYAYADSSPNNSVHCLSSNVHLVPIKEVSPMMRSVALVPLDVKGPLAHMEYNGKEYFTVYGKQKFAKKLAMIAGGTGIIPIYQVMQAILKDSKDDTKMYLVYANRTENDILLKDEPDAWAHKYPDKVKLCAVETAARIRRTRAGDDDGGHHRAGRNPNYHKKKGLKGGNHWRRGATAKQQGAADATAPWAHSGTGAIYLSFFCEIAEAILLLPSSPNVARCGRPPATQRRRRRARTRRTMEGEFFPFVKFTEAAAFFFVQIGSK